MRRVALALLLAISSAHGSEEHPDGWVDYLTTAHLYLTEKQTEFRELIDPYPQYFYDQDLGTIAFCEEETPKVVAKILVVGSTSVSGGTWLWSWANDSIVAAMSSPLESVREIGGQRGFTKLTESLWPGDETDGWEMTAVSGFILRADGAYRSPGQSGALFLLMFDPEPASEASPLARCN